MVPIMAYNCAVYYRGDFRARKEASVQLEIIDVVVLFLSCPETQV